MLISFDEYPQEYKYLEHIDNTKMYLFIDNNATPEEKANLKKYDENCLEIFGYHLIQNYDDLDK